MPEASHYDKIVKCQPEADFKQVRNGSWDFKETELDIFTSINSTGLL